MIIGIKHIHLWNSNRKVTTTKTSEQSETKDNVGVVKEEQVDHQSEQLSISNVITNYTILEGHITSESSTKLTGDVDVDGWTIVVTRSKENLENKDACEITAKKKTDANQPTDVEIPKTETKGNEVLKFSNRIWKPNQETSAVH